MLKRIFLFAVTNIAVITMISIIMAIVSRLFGVNLDGSSFIGMAITSVIIGFSGAFISLLLSRWSAKKLYNIVLIDQSNLQQASKKEQAVYALVQRIAMQHTITLPEVGVYVSTDPNAFATGRSKNASLVAVSSRLLEECSQDEIDGIIAHEMTHILNGDMVTMTLLQWVLNTFVVFFSRLLARIIDEATDGKLGWIWYQAVNLLLQIILGIGATLIAMKFSRYREYRADLGSAHAVGKAKMIAALRRLQKLYPETVQAGTANTMSAFQISSGEKLSLFASHPSLESRIQSLESNYQLP